MDRAIIGMPFDLAMQNSISRQQFYSRAQAVLAERDAMKDRIAALEAQLAAVKGKESAADHESLPLNACLRKRESTREWVLELSGSINGTNFSYRHTQPLSVLPERVPGLLFFGEE